MAALVADYSVRAKETSSPGTPGSLIAACRGARAVRPQKGGLRRAIADRKIEVKVKWNQLVAHSSQLVAGQARLHRLLFPVGTHVDVPAATLGANHARAETMALPSRRDRLTHQSVLRGGRRRSSSTQQGSAPQARAYCRAASAGRASFLFPLGTSPGVVLPQLLVGLRK